MKSIAYQGGQFDSSFNYVSPVQTAEALSAEQQRQKREVESVSKFNREQASEFQLWQAKLAGQDLTALGEFSKTLSEQLTKLDETITKNKEADDLYAALFGGDVSVVDNPEDAATDAAAYNVATTNAETANRVEQKTGNASLAQLAYTMDGGSAQVFVKGSASLTQARTRYPAWMATWMSSNNRISIGGQTMTVAEAVMSGNPALVEAAMVAGRRQFLQQAGLQGATRRQVARELGQTILNTDASLASAAVAQGVKAQREETISGLTSLAHNVAQENNGNHQANFDRLSNLFYTSPTGMTRSQANRAALLALGGGYAAQGNVEAIDALYDVLKIRNPDGTYQKGSQLGVQYKPELDKLRAQAVEQRDGIRAQAAQDAEANMYQLLANPNLTPEQRRDIVEATARQHEQNGNYERARQLRGMNDDLQVSGASQYNTSLLSDAIRRGEVRDSSTIEQAALLGQITQEQKATLLAQLETENGSGSKMPDDQDLKDLVKSESDRVEDNFLAAAGLGRDQYGRVIVQGSDPAVSVGDAQVLTSQMASEIRRVAIIAYNGTKGTQQDKLTAARRAVQEWRQINLSEDGKYGVKKRPDGLGYDPQNKTYLKNLANSSPVTLQTLKPGASIVPLDLDGVITPGETISSNVVSTFNPVRGDRVFTVEELGTMREVYETSGTFTSGLVKTADQLGMTPLALLQQQIAARGGKPVQAQNVLQRQATTSDPTNTLEGAQLLMSMGFPVRGAAFLSGNIMQESGWMGQRQPWDDVGAPAGGLVSWRGGRLDRAQAAFGSVTTANDQQQLQYMVQELKTRYPEAYAIFMNPRSTRKQLIRASKLFWGYGETGNRYVYADTTEAQLRQLATPGSTNFLKMTPKQRTVAVGRQLLSQGYVAWQHPNFSADHGYIADGTAPVGKHSPNSYHYVGQAIDFPIGDNGAAKLDELYNYLNSNRKQLGIVELIWRAPGHWHHLHVAFG